MNLILTSHKGISGSLINILDYSNFLCKNDTSYKLGYFYGYNVFRQLILKTKRNYNYIKYHFIKYEINCNILILDYITLLDIFDKYPIKCNKLIVFDCYELTLHINFNANTNNKIDIPLEKILSKIQYKSIHFNITPFLCNSFKLQYPTIKCFKNLKKIDFEALKTIKYSEKFEVFDRDINNINITNIFNFKIFNYHRRKEIMYIEQFGRLIFEFLILNKKVILPKNIYEKGDGVVDYLKEYLPNINNLNIWNYEINEVLNLWD